MREGQICTYCNVYFSFDWNVAIIIEKIWPECHFWECQNEIQISSALFWQKISKNARAVVSAKVISERVWNFLSKQSRQNLSSDSQYDRRQQHTMRQAGPAAQFVFHFSAFSVFLLFSSFERKKRKYKKKNVRCNVLPIINLDGDQIAR